MDIEARLAALGLTLPPPVVIAPHIRLPFAFVRVSGNRAYISGHAPLDLDGRVARPLGKVGSDLTIEQGYEAARLTALSILGSLRRTLGDLDRVTSWLRIFGMVNAAPGFNELPTVINGCSGLILELFGPERSAQARAAGGLAGGAFKCTVELEAEVAIVG